MGRLGMELGFTPRVLQQRVLGRMGETVSTTKRLVSPASNRVERQARLWRQLELPAARLPSSHSWQPSSVRAGALWSDKSSRRETDRATIGNASRGGPPKSRCPKSSHSRNQASSARESGDDAGHM